MMQGLDNKYTVVSILSIFDGWALWLSKNNGSKLNAFFGMFVKRGISKTQQRPVFPTMSTDLEKYLFLQQVSDWND